NSEGRSHIRNIMAAFIAEKAKKLSQNKNDIPAIILGDLNGVLALPSSSEEILSAPNELEKGGFTDVYREAENKVNGNYSTHDRITNGIVSSGDYLKTTGFGPKRIDYIFYY